METVREGVGGRGGGGGRGAGVELAHVGVVAGEEVEQLGVAVLDRRHVDPVRVALRVIKETIEQTIAEIRPARADLGTTANLPLPVSKPRLPTRQPSRAAGATASYRRRRAKGAGSRVVPQRGGGGAGGTVYGVKSSPPSGRSAWGLQCWPGRSRRAAAHPAPPWP